MKPNPALLSLAAAVSTWFVATASSLAQGTAFTYQGRLTDNGSPANGLYSLRFRLLQTNNGAPQGPVLTNNAVVVSNGLFTTTLDFGDYFGSREFGLELGVRSNGSALDFTTLSPTNVIRPSPVSIAANHAALAASVVQVPDGALSGTYGSTVNFNNSGNSFSGNGASLSNINATSFQGLAAESFWLVGGNGAVGNGILGSSSAQPLQFVVGNRRALQLEVASLSLGIGSALLSANVTGGAGGNTISNGVFGGTIAGGGNLTTYLFGSTPLPNVVSDHYGTVGGGLYNAAGNTNSTFDDAMGVTISGGISNAAAGPGATISGGIQNWAGATNATVGGGFSNQAVSWNATVGGGSQNSAGLAGAVAGGEANVAAGSHSTVGGGQANAASGDQSFIGGGGNNGAQSINTVVAGGANNSVRNGIFDPIGLGGQPITFANNSCIGGGENNVIAAEYIYPSGFYHAYDSTIAGGSGNTIDGVDYGMIPGGWNNTVSGVLAFAAGRRAKARHDGAFVWADSTDEDFASGGPNQFCIRASGGMGIGTGNPATKLHLYSPDSPTTFRIQSSAAPGFGRIEFVSDPQGSATEWRPGYIQSLDAGGFTGGLAFFVNGAGPANRFGAQEVMRVVNGNVGIGQINPTNRLMVGNARCDGNSWISSSDRDLKEGFMPVDSQAVLEKIAHLPITSWNYKTDSTTRHLGPVAQDFKAAFGLGPDDKSIATVDESGVALAAIQGLNQKLEEREEEMARLKAKNSQLEDRLGRLERALRVLEGEREP